MRSSRTMLKQVRRALAVAFLFSGCINLLMLATPLYTLQVFETVVPLGSLETLLILTLITGVAILALGLIEVARDMILLRAGLWLDDELGLHALRNGLELGRAPAELSQDARALEQLRSFLTTSAVVPLLDAPFVPIFLVTLWMLHPLIGAVGCAAALALLLSALMQTLLTGRAQQESQQSHQTSQQWWSTLANNSQLAGALGLARGATDQWHRFNRRHTHAANSLGKRTSVIKALARTVRIGSQIAVYGLGALLVVRHEIAPGALVASAILLARALAPIEQLVGAMRSATTAWRAYVRMKSLPADAELAQAAATGAKPLGHIVLSDVSVYHPGRRTPALRGLSLAFGPGECLCILGSNGSGKSTLAAMLAGAILPAAGAADLDGIPIARWQRVRGEPAIGFAADTPVLMEGSVHQNIVRFGGDSLMTAARAGLRAGVHERLQALSAGYETHVGNGGAGLSLSERRAVALARALHGNPCLVVLDEPEIGLDGAGLRSLINVLSDLKAEGVGLVLATQDPRLVTLGDKVAVLNAGALQTFGPRTEISKQLSVHKSEPVGMVATQGAARA